MKKYIYILYAPWVFALQIYGKSHSIRHILLISKVWLHITIHLCLNVLRTLQYIYADRFKSFWRKDLMSDMSIYVSNMSLGWQILFIYLKICRLVLKTDFFLSGSIPSDYYYLGRQVVYDKQVMSGYWTWLSS